MLSHLSVEGLGWVSRTGQEERVCVLSSWTWISQRMSCLCLAPEPSDCTARVPPYMRKNSKWFFTQVEKITLSRLCHPIPPGIGLPKAHVCKECLRRRKEGETKTAVECNLGWQRRVSPSFLFLFLFSSSLRIFISIFVNRREKGETEPWLAARSFYEMTAVGN